VTENLNYVKEPARDAFSNEHGKMLALRPSSFLSAPVLDGSNDVSFVGLAEHDLNFVHRVVFRILQQNVETSAVRLTPLP